MLATTLTFRSQKAYLPSGPLIKKHLDNVINLALSQLIALAGFIPYPKGTNAFAMFPTPKTGL